MHLDINFHKLASMLGGSYNELKEKKAEKKAVIDQKKKKKKKEKRKKIINNNKKTRTITTMNSTLNRPLLQHCVMKTLNIILS